jgi:prophage regulatory protein
MADRLLRLPLVQDKCGLKKSEIYDRMRRGAFPLSVALGPRAIAWLESEIDLWIAEKVRETRAHKNGGEIK